MRNQSFVPGILLVATGLISPAAGAPAERPPAQLVPEAPPRQLLRQCVQFMTVGHSDPSNEFRIGWKIPSEGWEHPITRIQAPCLEATEARWLWLHNPFGAMENERMQWSMRCRVLEAAERGDRSAAKIESSFLPVMRRLLQGEYTNGRRIGLVCYFGDATTDLRLAPLAEAGRLDEWRRQWEQSIEPVRRLAREFPGQVLLGADSIEELTATHPHFQMLQEVHNDGLSVIGEPRFLLDRPHLFRFGMVQTWRQDQGGFDRTDPDTFSDPPPRVGNDQILGPRFAFFGQTTAEHVRSQRITFEHLRRALRADTIPLLDMRYLEASLPPAAASAP